MKIDVIKEIIELSNIIVNKKVIINGWVRSFRNNKFIMINDGSSVTDLQIVINYNNLPENILKNITVGVALKIYGIIGKSKGNKQTIEILCSYIEIYQKVYKKKIQETIIQTKYHSLNKLREQAHLRFRTKLFSSIMRIRHHLSFLVHEFFYNKGFFYIQTPIITTFDTEGSGKMFRVTSFDLTNIHQGKIDENKDFFGRFTYLTVSGQLEGETAAMALGKIYTFGPIFRAENSNTYRHLSEFWMVEPEIAFYDLIETMDLVEEFIKYLFYNILDKCSHDLFFLSNKNTNILDRLYLIINNPFIKISYSQAMEILQTIYNNKFGKLKNNIIEWGEDLQSEHERSLVDYFKSPIILFDYPEQIKAFYMRLNENNKTVRSMDVILPEIGEIIGGSQREDRYDFLVRRMEHFGIDNKNLLWYLDTRILGSAIHSGFGLGFDRLVQFITGMNNIRDVIPYPRIPKKAVF
jgi:asparaginyl-tRNA synthetase